MSLKFRKLFGVLLSLNFVFTSNIWMLDASAQTADAGSQAAATAGTAAADIAASSAAATAAAASTTATAAATSPAAPTVPLNLDLSSTTANVSAAAIGLTAPVTISVGGIAKPVLPTDLLTPAELVAAIQVATQGQQSLNIAAAGNAAGGQFSLGGSLSQSIANLVIPQNVQLLHDFAHTPALTFTGDVTNVGSFVGYSTSSQVSTATINATNLINSGLLTTMLSALPSSITNATGGLNLVLNTVQNVMNAGIISSAGNLSINAGGSIINSLPAGVTGAAPVMSAINNLYLFSGAGSIINSGTMAAMAGNVNLNTLATNNLIMNNIAGLVTAPAGSINFRDSLLANKVDLNINGGNWIAKELNLFSGHGSLDANFGDVKGIVNTQAGAIHVLSQSDNLTLGKIIASGDPVYYNIGNIQLTNDVTVGEYLGILATGNITSTSGLQQITARDNSGQGYAINIVAGVALTPTPCGPCSSNASPGTEATVAITANGPSVTGGNIDFTQSSNLTINSNSVSGNLNGGNVTLAAYAVNAGTGKVLLSPNSQISSYGAGSGTNGDVDIIAGATSGTGMTVGSINATNSSSATGNIVLTNAQPKSSDNLPIVFNTQGQISSGNFFTAESSNTQAKAIVSGNLNAGLNLQMKSADLIVQDSSLSAGGSIQMQSSVAGASRIQIDRSFTSVSNNIYLSASDILIQDSTLSSPDIDIEGSGTADTLDLTILNSNVSSTSGNVDITSVGSGRFTFNAAGTQIHSAQNMFIIGNGSSMVINNVSSGPLQTGNITADELLEINGSGDLHVNNLGSRISSKNNDLCICNFNGDTYLYNNSDGYGNQGRFEVQTTGNLSISTNQDLIVTGNGIFGTNDPAGQVMLDANNLIVLGQGQIKPGSSLSIGLGGNAMFYIYSQDGSTPNPTVNTGPSIQSFLDNQGVTVYYGSDNPIYLSPDNDILVMAEGFSDTPSVNPNGILIPATVGNTLIALRNASSVVGLSAIAANNLFIESTGTQPLNLVNPVSTQGYTYLHSPNLITTQNISADRAITFATSGNSGASIINGEVRSLTSLNFISANVAIGTNSATGEEAVSLVASGGLNLSLTTGILNSDFGPVSIFNGGGSTSIYNLSKAYNYDAGEIRADTSMRITNAGGDLNIMNIDSTIDANNGDLNLIANAGGIYILNSSNEDGIWPASIRVQGTGNLNAISSKNLYVTGIGRFETNNGSINLTGASIVLSQQSVDASSSLNVDFRDNLLLYQLSGGTLSPTSVRGQAISSLTDLSSIHVYYASPHAQVVNANGAIILSTAPFTPVTVVSGVLTGLTFNGSTVVSVRSTPTITSVGNINSNGSEMYLDILNTNFNFTVGTISTKATGAANSGSLLVYSLGRIDAGNIDTSTNSPSTRAGDVRLFAPGQGFSGAIATDYIITTATGSTGTGNNAGSITMFAGGDVNSSDIDATSNATDGTGNGGNVLSIAYQSSSSYATVNSSTQRAIGNAGFIHLQSAFGVNSFSLIAEASGSTIGHGGAITLIESNDFNFTNGISVFGNLSNRVYTNGNAGYIVDPLTGLTGVKVSSTGNFFVFDINSQASWNGNGNGMGGNVSVSSESEISFSTIDTSSYSNTGNDANSGSVSLNAAQMIQGASVYAASAYFGADKGNSGNVSVNSGSGEVTLTGTIDTHSNAALAGNAGFIHLTASTGISVEDLYAVATNGSSGSISIATTTVGADITTGDIDNQALNGAAGGVYDTIFGLTGVNLVSAGALTVNSINSSGQNGGQITLAAQDDIVVQTDFSNFSIQSVGSDGGALNVATLNGLININGYISTNANGSGGNPGSIFMSAPRSISIGSLSAVANSFGTSGNGGIVKFAYTDAATESTFIAGGLIAAEGLLSFRSPGSLKIMNGSGVLGLTLLSGNNISITSGGTTTLESRSAGQGQNIYLIAGADLVVDLGNNIASVLGASSSGGNVNLQSTISLTFDTKSVAADCPSCDGGSTTLLSYNAGPNTGQVNLAQATILDQTGSGSGTSGSTTIVAGSSDAIAMKIGSITGPSGPAAGSLIINNAQPTTDNGFSVEFDVNSGLITSGNSFIADPFGATIGEDIITGNINIAGDIIFNSSNVLIRTANVMAGGNVLFTRPTETPDIRLNLAIVNGSLFGNNITIVNNSGGNTAVSVANSNFLANNDFTMGSLGGSLSLSNLGGTIQTTLGAILISNVPGAHPGPGIAISNSGSLDGSIPVGTIRAGTTLNVQNNGGGVGISNTGGLIVSNNAMNIMSTGGSVSIINTADCAGNDGTIKVDITGNLTVTASGTVQVIGNGIFGTDAPAHNVVLTSTNGSIIFNQDQVLAPVNGFKINYTSNGNALLYCNTSDLNPQVDSGPALSSFTDNTGIKLYYFGQHTSLFGDDVLILSTGTFTDNGAAGGTLSVTAVTGDLIISNRNDPNLTAIAALSTNGNDVYVESTGSNGINFTGDLNTQVAGGSGGSATIYSNGAGTTLQNVVTAGLGNGDGGGLLVISSGGNLLVNGSINTSGSGLGNGGGVMLSTSPGSGDITLNGNINTVGGNNNTFGGGGVTIVSCGACIATNRSITSSANLVGSALRDAGSIQIFAAGNVTTGPLTAIGNSAFNGHAIRVYSGGAVNIAGAVDSSAFDTFAFDSDAGIVYIGAASGITVTGGSILAGAWGPTNGNGASITLQTSSGNINTLGISNSVLFNGVAGAIFDGLSGNIGITLDAGGPGSISVNGEISSTAAQGGGRGSGGDVTVHAGSTFQTANPAAQGIDASSYGSSGFNNNAGNVSIDTGDTITVNHVLAASYSNGANGRGGNIDIESLSGTLVYSGSVDSTSYGSVGGGNDAGSIDISVDASLTIGFIRAIGGFNGGSGNGGNIGIESRSDSVTLTSTTDFPNSSSYSTMLSDNNAGAIQINALSNIDGTDLIADGGTSGGNGGAINAESSSGMVNFTGDTGFQSNGNGYIGSGGSLTANGNDGVTVKRFNSNGGLLFAGGGDITVQAPDGAIEIDTVVDSSAARVNYPGAFGNGGAIQISASDDVNLGLNFMSDDFCCVRSNGGDAGGNGGGIEISSSNGSLVLGRDIDINASACLCQAGSSNAGNGGPITVDVDGNVSLSGAPLARFLSNGGVAGGNGGDVSITAGSNVYTSDIRTSAAPVDNDFKTIGKGGKITIDAGGEVVVQGILSSLGGFISGDGGNVEVTSGAAVTVTSAIESYASNRFIFSGAGTAGSVEVNAIDGIDIGFYIGAYGGTSSSGNNVTLMTEHGAISTGSFVGANGGLGAGNIIAITGFGAPCPGCINDSITINGNADTSAGSYQAVDSGFIHLEAINGISVSGGVFTNSNGPQGDSGAITLISTGNGPDDNITARVVSNRVANAGDAGSVTDTVNGFTGINIQSGGSVTIDDTNPFDTQPSINGMSGPNDFATGGSGSTVNVTAGTTITLSDSIDTSNYGSASANAGHIILLADGMISTKEILAQAGIDGAGDGGQVSITSTSDFVSVDGFIDNSAALDGSSLGTTIHAATGVTVSGDIVSTGGVNTGLGGAIDISTTDGEAQLEGLDSRSLAGEGSGTISVSAPAAIFADIITSAGGGVESGLSGDGASITLTSLDGVVEVRNINASSFVPPDAGPNFHGGDVTITAGDSITIGDSILLDGGISTVGVGNGYGGAVTITSTGNNGNFTIYSADDAGISAWGGIGGGGGGMVDVQVVGDVSIKQIGTSAAGVVTGGPTGPLTGTGNGGGVLIDTFGSVIVSTTINTEGGPDGGDAGFVTVTSANSFIQIGPISAKELNGFGFGGEVSLQADMLLTVGSIETNGGTDGGGGGLIELISGNSSITSGFLDSSAPTDGSGGDIFLTATNGLIAVNGTSGLGAAINSSSAGTNIFNLSGLVDILFGSAAGEDFVIDKNNLSITNGTKGAILATSENCGCANSVSISNALGDLAVTLNDKIDVRGEPGSMGVIYFNNPGTAVTVTGNSAGELLGFVNASGNSVNITLNKSATTLYVDMIQASSTPPDLGVTLNVNVGASQIILDDIASITSDSGDINIFTPTLTTEGEIIADIDSIFITAGTVHNSNLIQALNGTVAIGNTGNLVVDTTIGGVPQTTGTLEGTAIVFNSLNGSVNVVQENVYGGISGSAHTDFFVEALDSSLTADGEVNATTGTLTMSAFSSSLSVLGSSQLTAGVDIDLSASSTITIENGDGGTDPLLLDAGRDVLISGGTEVSIGDGSPTHSGFTIKAGQDVSISSFSSSVEIHGASASHVSNVEAGRDIDVLAHQNITMDNTASAQGLQLTADRNVTITSEHDSVLFNDLGATYGIGVSAGVLSLGNNPASLNMGDYNYSAFSSPGNIMVTAGDGDISVNSNVNMVALGGDIGLAATEDIYIGGLVVGPTLIGSFFAQGGNIWMTAGEEVEIGNASNGTTINSVARFTGGGIIPIGPGWGVQSYRGGGLAVYAGVPIADFNQLLSSLQSQRVPPGDHNVVVDPGVDVTGTPLVLATEDNPGGNLLNFPYVEFRLTYPNGTPKGVTAFISTTDSPVFNIDGGIVSIDPAGTIEITNTAFNVIGPPLVPLTIVHASPPLPPVVTLSEPTPPINITTPSTMTGSEVVPTDITRGRGYNLARTEVADAINNLLAPIFMSQDLEDLQNWLYVSSHCQPYMFDDDDTMIFGRTGTIFAARKDHKVKLQEGRLVLVTDRRPLTVETNRGEVMVPEDSVAIVDENSSGVVRVLSLSGKDTKCSVGTGSEQTLIAATSGQEVVVADSSIGEEELIAVDGVERQPVGGTITVGKLQVRKQSFDRKRMWEEEPLFNCKMSDQWDPVRKQVTKLRQHMGGQQVGEQTERTKASPLSILNVPALKQASSATDSFADNLQPVAYRTPANSVPPGSVLMELSSKNAVVKYNSASEVTMNADDLFTLSKGDLLVSTTKTTIIRCGKYHVSIDPGTIALISMNGNTMKVHDLWESKGSSMHVYAGPKLVSMTVGQELIVSSTEAPIAQEMRKDQIGRRRVHMYQLSKAEAASQAEVSIVSLILGNRLLSDVFHSKQSADHSLSEKLIKMAACLTQATATHGPYSTSSR